MSRTRKSTFSGQDADPLQAVEAAQPSSKAVKPEQAKMHAIGQETGFSARHATEESQATSQKAFDARSLRKSSRTSQLNIAIQPATKDRFWKFAIDQGVTTGEDALLNLLDRAGG